MASPTAGWIVRAASVQAQSEWEEAAAREPELMAVVRDRLRSRPLDRSDNPNRTHRLRPPLAEKVVGGRRLPQWQHEISSGGRVFYCVDSDDHVVWVTLVSLAHPRATGR